MARARSRNYPAISLADAIERAKALYKQEGRAAAPAEVVVRAWGYNSLNGASLRVVSALRQYGLVEGSNEQVRLSPRALTLILEPETHPEYSDALHEALQAPALFQDIVQEYGEDLPSDPALISYLVRKQNFGEGAAKTLIEAFRDSVDLVKSKVAGYTSSTKANNVPSTELNDNDSKALDKKQLRATKAAQLKEFTFPLSDDTVVTLSITGPMPRGADLAMFTDWLELVKRQVDRAADDIRVVLPSSALDTE